VTAIRRAATPIKIFGHIRRFLRLRGAWSRRDSSIVV
jgi:hypothetical protein